MVLNNQGSKMAKSMVPSERELDLLKIMWRLGEAKVREIHETLCPNGECAFTTVQTLLRIMCRKGLIDKRSEGRTDYYSPVYTLENATSHFINKVFDGAIDKYVISMLSAENVSPDELRALEKQIAKARKSKRKNEEE